MLSNSTTPLDAGLGGVNLSNQDLNNLRTAGKWGRFISIVMLISMAIVLLFVVLLGGTMGTMIAATTPELAGTPFGGAGFSAFIIGFYGFSILLYVYPMVQLYKFSSRAIKTADANDPVAASAAFVALKSMFKYIGILFAIVLGLYALLIVFSLVGGLIAATVS